jgi:hypothetical protein
MCIVQEEIKPFTGEVEDEVAGTSAAAHKSARKFCVIA